MGGQPASCPFRSARSWRSEPSWRSSSGTRSSTGTSEAARSRRLKAAPRKADSCPMERASAPLGVPRALDPALFAAAVRAALHEAAARDDPLGAIDAAVAALHEAAEGLLPSVFVIEHGRLWLVAQRGYGVVPDGIAVEQGIMGRDVRLGRGQIVVDVHSDPDYIAALPTVTSEAAMPLRAGRAIVGVFNLDAERPLSDGTLKLARPLAAALAPLAEALRAAGGLDLPGVARLFVHLGSLRDPNEIAALSAASLARVV